MKTYTKQKISLSFKLLFLCLLISLIVNPFDTFAHGWTKTRNNTCSGFDIAPWMFRARARVAAFGFPSQQTSRDCPESAGGSGNGVAFAGRSNYCAWQTARNEWGASTLRGRVTRNRRLCSRGSIYSDLYYGISSYLDIEDEEFEESDIYSSKVIFEENSIKIDTINGSFIQKGNNLISSYELVMWLPKDDTDSIIKNDKTFFYGKIELANGQVNTYGDFEEINYELINHPNGETEVVFDELIYVQLPDSVNGLSTLIEVSATSHGEEDEEGDISDFLDQSNNLFNVSITPNPTSGEVDLNIESFDNEEKTYSVQVFDNNMLKVFEGYVSGGVSATMEINFNNLNITKGFVYILISFENKGVLKKVIYQ